MTTETQHGAPQFPTTESAITASTRTVMDDAISTLRSNKDKWVQVPVSQRIAILDALIKSFAALVSRWVGLSLEAKGLTPDSPFVGEEWMAGAWPILKNLRLLRQSLADIEAHGSPRIPGPIRVRPGGQVVAQVFPQTPYDRLFFRGVTAEIWMEPGVTEEGLPHTQALVYQDKKHAGKVALVLGAGNVASIGPMDILYKMFVEDQVVLYKANPVNAYLGPLIEESFRDLIEPGYLRIVYGGAEEGAYLCQHQGIDEIHITGSDKTFDAIVFGTGSEGAKRKAQGAPLLMKRVTGELGNVSPVIVVPGPWTERDLAYQAEHIVSMLTNNAGFNCNATRVIIQQAGWEQRTQLLQQMRGLLSKVPIRKAYYPGAKDRHALFTQAHPDAEQFGSPAEDQLPWTLIAGVDPQNQDDPCFTTEAFCGLFAETALDVADPATFLEQAVAFCNDQLWGTLNATILIHPQSLKDPVMATALDRAIADLLYGSIGVNYWAAASFALVVTTWGAFPGHPIEDIQSGTGYVHNTLMFGQAQKSVIRGPFRSTPVPPWFVLRGNTARKIFPRLVKFEAAPAPWKVPDIMLKALRG